MPKVMPTKMIDGIEVQPCKNCFHGFKNGSGKVAVKGSLFYPIVQKVQDLYYARCSNPECQAYHQHEFIGLRARGAYEQWNERMMPPKDSSMD